MCNEEFYDGEPNATNSKVAGRATCGPEVLREQQD
jgi:hypothetical protein